MGIAKRSIVLAFLICAVLVAGGCGVIGTANGSAPRGIKVSFKLDPRVTKSLYMGERWVSPSSYSAPTQGKETVIDAKAEAVDASGEAIAALSPTWTAKDGSMVSVTPAEGSQVQIRVRQAGESEVRVQAKGLSKTLRVKAVTQGEVLRVTITQ